MACRCSAPRGMRVRPATYASARAPGLPWNPPPLELSMDFGAHSEQHPRPGATAAQGAAVTPQPSAPTHMLGLGSPPSSTAPPWLKPALLGGQPTC
jgi:hypothetical protein